MIEKVKSHKSTATEQLLVDLKKLQMFLCVQTNAEIGQIN